MLTSSVLLTTAHDAEQHGINNIVLACGIDAALLEDRNHGGQNRFAAVPLSAWERAQKERNALYYQFKLIQVFERGDYDAPLADEPCSSQIVHIETEQRTSRNRLRIDYLDNPEAPRCLLKTPTHWPVSATASRWVLSGGDVHVFGRCYGEASQNCPRHKEAA